MSETLAAAVVSRRRFLRGLTLAGGGLAAASLLAACQPTGTAPSSGAPSGPPPSGPPPTQPPAAPAAAAPAGQPTTAAQTAPAASGAVAQLKVGATIPLTGRYASLGGAGSDLHAAGATLGDKNKTPYLGVAFALYSVHQKGLKYLFSPFPKSPDIAKNVYEHMDTLSPKPTKVALFTEQTDWGNELRELWNKEATSRRYDVVADEQYAPGAKDFSAM